MYAAQRRKSSLVEEGRAESTHETAVAEVAAKRERDLAVLEGQHLMPEEKI